MKKKLLEIQETSFNFFNDFTNLDKRSKGYGLTVDHLKNSTRASIASTGFTLSNYVIADCYNYLSRDEIIKRVIGTLKTLYYHTEHYEGFFSHFIEINTGKRYKKSEFSTIDTALAINGILTCQNYFKDSTITKYADLIVKRINWRKLIHQRDGKTMLYMAYNDDPTGDYANGKSGFIHHWSMFAEQLMIYLFIAGDSRFSKEESQSLYEGFERLVGTYRDYQFIYTPGNTLFVYQYPLMWLDLKDYYDKDEINWYENAKQATLSQYQWAVNDQSTYRSFKKHFFGLTASHTQDGYQVFHSIPNVFNKVITDGTVVPSAIIGSLPITPNIAKKGIKELFKIKELWHEKYGFYDAFNFEKKTWISDRIYAINKGLEMLMVNAYLTQDVQKSYMSHPLIVKGLKTLEWKERKK
ncbi:MAG: hypothetical protein GX149_05150 [Acholeplasmataceae bacterium]|nr:hypothetical protein [Acholeplasmataceae bacterium]